MRKKTTSGSRPAPAAVQALVAAARAAATQAYSPYSKVCVGAALLAEDGSLYIGCNVENASYGLTICAERVAIGNAVAAGARRFRALAIATNQPRVVMPCGACRQVLMEFAPDLELHVAGPGKERVTTTLADLLPAAFLPKHLR
ncbi:MAG: cytidine deaminase [Planctomycetia bacterium]